LRLQAAFGKKRSSYLRGEREDEAIYAKVKAASYDKIYAIASKGSSKQERTAAFEAVKEGKSVIY
jgi:polyribonucleotide nucleotidyltransferase